MPRLLDHPATLPTALVLAIGSALFTPELRGRWAAPVRVRAAAPPTWLVELSAAVAVKPPAVRAGGPLPKRVDNVLELPRELLAAPPSDPITWWQVAHNLAHRPADYRHGFLPQDEYQADTQAIRTLAVMGIPLESVLQAESLFCHDPAHAETHRPASLERIFNREIDEKGRPISTRFQRK